MFPPQRTLVSDSPSLNSKDVASFVIVPSEPKDQLASLLCCLCSYLFTLLDRLCHKRVHDDACESARVRYPAKVRAHEKRYKTPHENANSSGIHSDDVVNSMNSFNSDTESRTVLSNSIEPGTYSQVSASEDESWLKGNRQQIGHLLLFIRNLLLSSRIILQELLVDDYGNSLVSQDSDFFSRSLPPITDGLLFQNSLSFRRKGNNASRFRRSVSSYGELFKKVRSTKFQPPS